MESSDPAGWRRRGLAHKPAAWGAGGAFLVLAGIGTAELSWWTLAMLFLCVGGIAGSSAASRLMRAIEVSDASTLRELIVTSASAKRARAVFAVRHGVQVVMPTGWREVRIGFHVLDRLLDPVAGVRGYLLGLVLLPVFIALAFAWMLSTGSNADRNVIGAIVGYNALVIASCLTAGLIITVVVMVVLTYARVLVVELDLRRVFTTIAAWIGTASAIGAVTAALLPLLGAFVPGYSFSASASQGILTPSVLVDVPAGFAVVGYAGGILHATVEICRGARNLIVWRVAAPAVFVLALLGLVKIGLGPFGILAALIAPLSSPAVIGCADGEVSDHLGDAAWLIRAAEYCGDGRIYVDDQAFLWWVAVCATALVLVAFASDFRRRARAMHADAAAPPVRPEDLHRIEAWRTAPHSDAGGTPSLGESGLTLVRTSTDHD